jgi:enoyl-CoA hydratase/carnithine racemase
MKKAMEMVLTGDPVSAEEALRLGMITRVCPAEELMGETRRLAQRLAQGPVTAMGVIKRTLHEAQNMGFAETLETECRRQARLMTQPDFMNAARSFFQKKKPTFS